MECNQLPDNVISFRKKKAEKRNMTTPIQKHQPAEVTRVVAVTSGKGGVGKTNIVANMGYLFSRMKKKTLVFDADLGLGNLDILLGLAPRYNFSHVITGEKTVDDIVVEGPGGMKILPASSGIQELTELSNAQTIRVLSDLELYIDPLDLFLIDTGAGISRNVMSFNASAHDVVVIVSPEPTSITDAYALMKVLSVKYSTRLFSLVVNMATSHNEAKDVFRQLRMVTDRFLDIEIQYLGHVAMDGKMARCVKRQQLICEVAPESPAAMDLASIARKILARPSNRDHGRENHFFWGDLFQNGGE
jgi:flagellar biosynthesis protein FlhG